MARLEPEHHDARDRAQSLINLEARRVLRRMKRHAEEFIAERYAEASVKGLPFDHVKVADAAFAHAQEAYMLEASASPAELEAEASEVEA